LTQRPLLLELGQGEWTDLLAIDDQVPDGLSGRLPVAVAVETGIVEHPRFLLIESRDRIFTAGFLTLDHDDVAALLARDLEDLAPDFLVGNRVFRGAIVAHDLHCGPRGLGTCAGKSL